MVKLDVDRLLELMEKASPETSAAAVLEQWKREYNEAIAEQQARAIEYAKQHPTRYAIVRVEESLQESAGNLLPIYRAAEFFDVRIDELASFAKAVGARPEDVQALVNAERKEVITKRGIFRSDDRPSWSASKLWRDRSQEQADREALLEEDRQTVLVVAAINAGRVISAKPEPASPTYSTDWRTKK